MGVRRVVPSPGGGGDWMGELVGGLRGGGGGGAEGRAGVVIVGFVLCVFVGKKNGGDERSCVIERG